MNVDGIRSNPLFRERGQCLGVLEARGAPALGAAEIRRALAEPIGLPAAATGCCDIVQPGESVCIVVSDQTRRTAADRVLPVLLDGLAGRGCRMTDISILVATGIHRRPSAAEIRHILGDDSAARLAGRVVLHDPDDDEQLVSVGTTRRGQDVRINRAAVETDRLILLGAAVYHYHAGFGGGRKSLVPGIASRDTIAQNHSLTLDADRIHPAVQSGRLDGNPVAEEMLAAAKLHPPDFIINTVLDPRGRLVGIFAGELDAAHRAACRCVETLYRLDLDRAADLVIASAEGAQNWVQSHKALHNAWRARAPHGLILLVAPAPEGLGDERLRYWLQRPDVASVYRELRSRPEVLGQTALSTRTKAERTILVTELPDADLHDLRMQGVGDVGAGIDLAVERLAAEGVRRPTCYLMPQARYTVPFTATSGSGSRAG